MIKMTEIETILEKYQFVQRDNLIPILQDMQDAFGFLSEEAIVKVGKYLDIPTSQIYGLATFYNQFRFEPQGKYHIRICNGASCHVHSNAILIKELQKQLGIKDKEITKDGTFSLQETTCMGACGSGPVLSVNDKYYTQVNLNRLTEIIKYYKNLEE